MLFSRGVWPRYAVCVAVAIFAITARHSLVAASDLQLRIVDQNGGIIPCRVLVRDSGGACRTPENAILLEIGPDRWFMSDGNVRLDVPEGDYEVRIERGLEFRRFKSRVVVPANGLNETVRLTRWINMHDLGFLCGENHLHVDTKSLGPMTIAEGLDFGSSLTWWNGPDLRRPVPSGDGRTRILEFAGREITASVHDAELEHPWGAAYIQYLPNPFPVSIDTTLYGRAFSKRQPNLPYLRYAVDNGAIVHYQGGWSREVGLDALLGLVHTVNVCNNNFHLHRFQPRSRYSNLLEVEGFPVYPDTDIAMMQMNTDTWYRLLNWGLKLAAGAGSASGVKQVPVGYNRAYVRVDRNASLREFNEAWKFGKNFVTNGPVILLRGADGQSPGDEMTMSTSPEHLEFSLTVLSDQPLQTIEVVQNGQVVTQFAGDNQKKSEHQFRLEIDGSCWIAARCTARDDHLTDEELQQYDRPPRQQPSRLRFAHTSPIYVTVDGKPAIVRSSVEEGLQMLDQLQKFADEQAAPELREDFGRAIRQGRNRLSQRM